MTTLKNIELNENNTIDCKTADVFFALIMEDNNTAETKTVRTSRNTVEVRRLLNDNIIDSVLFIYEDGELLTVYDNNEPYAVALKDKSFFTDSAAAARRETAKRAAKWTKIFNNL